MTTLLALGSVVAVSLVSLIGIFTLSLHESVLKKFIFIVVSVSVGALFGDAFIHLIPGSFESSLGASAVSLLIILGILIFFILEKFLHWRHSHGQSEEGVEGEARHDHSRKPLGSMILVSDGIHNFIDGLIIGAAFFVSPEVGLATAAAIILHEIPQEIANFGLLLHSGFSRARALLWNFISALPAILGTLLALFLSAKSAAVIPAMLPLAAGSFVYIAGSDLVPELMKTRGARQSLIQFAAVLLGIALMYALLFLEP